MSLVGVAWVAGVLSDPVTGINAQLADVPKLDAWPTPKALPTLDECTTPWVASDKFSPSAFQERSAFLIVRRYGALKGDVLPAGNGYDAGEVAVHFCAKQVPDDDSRAKLGIIAWQTLRTARRVLTQAMPEFIQPTYPRVAGCEFGVSDQNVFEHLAMQTPVEGGLLFDALLVRFAIHDWWALGLDAPQTP